MLESNSIIDILSTNDNDIILNKAKDYISNIFHNNDISAYNLFYAWYLFTKTCKHYFDDYSWNEPIQNKILNFFNIKINEHSYINDNLTKMFCIYTYALKYKRKIMDYERLEPKAYTLSNFLTKTKESYNKISKLLRNLCLDIICKPNGARIYNVIDYYEDLINYELNNIAYNCYFCKLDPKIDKENCKLILNINFIKTDTYSRFINMDEQLKPLFDLIQEDITYFNTYGYFYDMK